MLVASLPEGEFSLAKSTQSLLEEKVREEHGARQPEQGGTQRFGVESGRGLGARCQGEPLGDGSQNKGVYSGVPWSAAPGVISTCSNLSSRINRLSSAPDTREVALTLPTQPRRVPRSLAYRAGVSIFLRRNR